MFNFYFDLQPKAYYIGYLKNSSSFEISSDDWLADIAGLTTEQYQELGFKYNGFLAGISQTLYFKKKEDAKDFSEEYERYVLMNTISGRVTYADKHLSKRPI